MLNLDPSGFLDIQSGAVALAGPLDTLMGELIASGAPNVHFLGSGGAAILMQPAVQLMRRRSTFPVYSENISELMAAGSANLTKGSIVILPSLSGTTKESVDFLDHARRAGATVVALVGDADTPLGTGSDHTLANQADDRTSSESFYIQSLLIALSLMRHRGEIGNYDALLSEMQGSPQVLLDAKVAIEPRADEYAAKFAGNGWHIITGAGNAWPQAFYYGMCILEEMQWIRTRPVHASDFFHGTLELVEKGVSVLVLKGEDEMRPLAERVEAFVPKVGGDLTVIDTADIPLAGLSPEARGLLSPAILATMLERVSAHLEVLRDHPLTTRRYYRRVAY